MNAQELRFECLKLAQGDINKAKEYYNFSVEGPDSPDEQPLKAPRMLGGLSTSNIQPLDFQVKGSLGSYNVGLAEVVEKTVERAGMSTVCLLYTSLSPRDGLLSRMPSSA